MGQGLYNRFVDNKATNPMNTADQLHAIKYEYNPEYREAYDRQAAVDKFAAENMPLQDQSLNMALIPGIVLNNGLGLAAAYSNAPMTIAKRAVNVIQEQSPRALIGAPRMSDIKAFLGDNAAREKVLWTGTGNAVKYNNLNNQ